MRTFRRPYGFSLIELLVCSCIVIVLLTLLGPLLLAAQVNSSEQKCKNNLKQIAIALHNYHDTYNTFPPGWITKNRASLEAGGSGWQAALLPYVDQAPLYNQINFSVGFDIHGAPEDLKPLRTVVKLYRCPSDTMSPTNPLRENMPTSNYSGNGGHRPFAQWSAVPGKSFWPGSVGAMPGRDATDDFGRMFGPNSHCRIASFIDGTSNTIMVGEKSAKSGAGIWAGVTSNSQQSDVLTDGSHASRLQQSVSSFSSFHKNVLFMIADGSVRSIKPDIDSQPNTDPRKPLGLFQRLILMNDGQPLNE